MHQDRSLSRCLTVLAAVLLLSLPCQAQTSPPDYLTQVKPLLRERCFACHGALQQKAELRLDTQAAMVKGGESGSALAPGDPARSSLLTRVTASDPAERMPPEHEGEPLTEPQVALLRQWIEAGPQLRPTRSQKLTRASIGPFVPSCGLWSRRCGTRTGCETDRCLCRETAREARTLSSIRGDSAQAAAPTVDRLDRSAPQPRGDRSVPQRSGT